MTQDLWTRGRKTLTIDNTMNDKKVVYLEKSDTGATLSTWLYCAMWQLYTAEQMGYVGYVHWPQIWNRSLLPHQDPEMFAKCPNMFEWYFEQPCYKGSGVPPRTLAWEWEHCPEQGVHCLMGQPLSVIKDWYQKHLLFNPTVKARIEELVQKYSIDFNNTLGISWRGCDSVMDGRPRQPIETYFPHIDAILEKEPGLRIFATAEETTVTDKIQARYPSAFTISEFFAAPWGYPGHSENVNPASGYERGIQTCGLISILSRCKHYIKNRSNMSCTAGYLSNGHIVYMDHPEICV